ncbi:unnamed protein product [Didymodactylos carnosus]|uniref:Uncharacterized protein n=1 Tax=Didymodactylos carnosus TaxID=1234261 RepID=A0A8S2UDC1_9BILA|nr:unnamed protein product [Didymodactylos carnosus]CAF4337872.1 unnamed protein product [Didymodactylos carnosus]
MAVRSHNRYHDRDRYPVRDIPLFLPCLLLFTQSVMTTTIDRPNLIYQTSNYTVNPVLSYSGELVVIETMDIKKGTGSKLLVFDTVNGGQHIGTLDDGIDVNVMPKQFAPLPNDARLLAKSNRNGVSRPLIWNVRTNERVDFVLDQLSIVVGKYYFLKGFSP